MVETTTAKPNAKTATKPSSSNDKTEPQTTALAALWDQCKEQLKREIDQQPFNTWLAPLTPTENHSNGPHLILIAPNRFIVNWVSENFLERILQIIADFCPNNATPKVSIKIKSMHEEAAAERAASSATNARKHQSRPGVETAFANTSKNSHASIQTHLNTRSHFGNFVEGKSNQVGLAAAKTVSENPGKAYNPLLIYGGVGLGKTHLMHAAGNAILERDPGARVLYLHSERFVADMIRALQRNAMNAFKRYYRGLNALLIDDIQFFAGKDRSQEEFFHTFNALLDGHQQIILTCDRYPKEISGLEERLKSRFGWGLTVAIEPPELETRVAILMTKAEELHVNLPHEVAFFIAKHIQSNVRELEGALKRVVANAQFTGLPITLDFARDALKDLLTLQAKLVSIDNIQRTVADYYKIKNSDILSKRRNRSIARPRQIAMALSKQLTQHSLPEIGSAFGGRDHTTVLHACRKIKELMSTDLDVQEDWKNLIRILTA